MAQQRFPIRFTGANKAMAVLGLRAPNTDVEVGADTVAVRVAYCDPAALREGLATPAPA
jgi:hypothetical protein